MHPPRHAPRTAQTRPPHLLDQVRQLLHLRHYSPNTEKVYVRWIVRFIRFHKMQHPKTLGVDHVEQFLSWLATERKVAPSTQNQSLAAILFLYRQVLDINIETARNIVRAKRPKHLPAVLTRDEVAELLRELGPSARLPAGLLYALGCA